MRGFRYQLCCQYQSECPARVMFTGVVVSHNLPILCCEPKTSETPSCKICKSNCGHWKKQYCAPMKPWNDVQIPTNSGFSWLPCGAGFHSQNTQLLSCSVATIILPFSVAAPLKTGLPAFPLLVVLDIAFWAKLKGPSCWVMFKGGNIGSPEKWFFPKKNWFRFFLQGHGTKICPGARVR